VNEHERRATTEALFRDVNERIAESAEGFDGDRTEFVCECADPNCTHRVPASLTEYEEVRAEPTTFLLADRLGGGACGRRSLRELLDPRVDAGPLQHLGDSRDRLRPAFHD